MKKKTTERPWSEHEQRAVNTLAPDFHLAGEPDRMLFKCRTCGAAWGLTRRDDGTVHGGNVLRLLDHAASHKKDGAR